MVLLVLERLEAERGVQVVGKPLGRAPERAGQQADQADQDRAAGQGEQRVRHDRRRFMADMRAVAVRIGSRRGRGRPPWPRRGE